MFRGVEIASAFYSQQSPRPSRLPSVSSLSLSLLLREETRGSVCSPLHFGSITWVWRVRPGWRAGGCPSARVGTLTSATVSVRYLRLQTKKPGMSPHSPGKCQGKKYACEAVQKSLLQHCNLCLHQTSFFRPASVKKVGKNILRLNLNLQLQILSWLTHLMIPFEVLELPLFYSFSVLKYC